MGCSLIEHLYGKCCWGISPVIGSFTVMNRSSI